MLLLVIDAGSMILNTGSPRVDWVAHASRVLVSVSRRNNLPLCATRQCVRTLRGKFAIARTQSPDPRDAWATHTESPESIIHQILPVFSSNSRIKRIRFRSFGLDRSCAT